ncbi:hypothetical protein, partial [Clostridium sp. UBA2485]
MQGRIKILKDVDKSNILPITHAKAVYVDEKNTLDEKLNNIESQIIQQTKTYDELIAMRDNEQLITGRKYALSDYRTKYLQPTTEVIKTATETEVLVLTASSRKTFEPIVASRKYPKDIVYYDIDNNLCEDNATPRKGFILRRYDPISGNDAPQDWRSMLWARYKPSKTSYYRNGTAMVYRIWEASLKPALDVVYIADNKLWMAKNTNVPTSPTDNNVFFEVYPDLDTPLLMDEKTTWGDGIELMRGELVEVPTFSEECKNNIIETSSTQKPHNNVFLDNCTGNSINKNCSRNTFVKKCNFNSIGKFSISNIFSECVHNTLSNSCDNNIFLKGSNYNTLSNFCSGNIFLNNSYQNFFGIRCSNNILTSLCIRNNLGNECKANKFGHAGYS